MPLTPFSVSLMIAAISIVIPPAVAAPGNNSNLEIGKTYIVEWIGERPLMDYSHLTLLLENDGRASGIGGCSRWSSRFQLEGDRLRLTQPYNRPVKERCPPALLEQEQRFLEALPKVVRWDFSPVGQLRLWPAEGAPVRLWPEEPQQQLEFQQRPDQ